MITWRPADVQFPQRPVGRPTTARRVPESARLTPSLVRTSAPRQRAWPRWLPVALILFDLLLDLVVPQDVAAGFALIALPALAAFTVGPGATALFSLVALVLEVVLAARRGHLAEQHHLSAYAATAFIAVLSIFLARVRVRQERNLVQARTVAEALQLTLLRPVPARVASVAAAGLYRAAEEGGLIGGDLYDVCETPFGVRVVVGDVRGKGLGAVRTVADLLGSYRALAYEAADLTVVAAAMERTLQRESAEGDDELFATALLLQYAPQRRELTLLNRGHLEAILLGPDGAREIGSQAQLPLGLGDLGAAVPGHGRTPAVCHPTGDADLVLLYTDGISEARDAGGCFYPILQRLTERFGPGTPAVERRDPVAVLRFLAEDVQRYAGAATDDIAVVGLQLLSGP